MTPEIWRKYTDWPLMIAAGLFLLAYSILVIGHSPGSHSGVVQLTIWVTWAAFVIDYVVNLAMAHRRGSWFIRHLPDLIILAVPVLRPLRLLRLAPLLRMVDRISGSELRGRILTYVLGTALLLTYVSALAVLDAESNSPHSNIHTIGDALWWAVVTITTVGYGDYYPVTAVGRLVAVALMIGGIAVLGVVTAAIASWLVEHVGEKAATEAEGADVRLLAEVARLSSRLDELVRHERPHSGEPADDTTSPRDR